jgi:hypothetical protein
VGGLVVDCVVVFHHEPASVSAGFEGVAHNLLKLHRQQLAAA